MDSDFLESECFVNSSSASCHRSFLKNWEDYGVFVYSKNESKSIPDAVKSLPQKYRKMWEAAFQYYAKVEVDVSDFKKDLNFNVLIDNHIYYKTFMVEDTTGMEICGDEGMLFDAASSYEVVSASVFSESENFKKSEEISVKDIDRGSRIDSVWSDYFLTLTNIYDKIVIVDNYFIKRLCSSNINKNAFKSFIKKLINSDLKYDITIYSRDSYEGKCFSNDAESIIESIIQTPVMRKKISKVTICGINSEFFSATQIAHDRYVRVGEFVCQLGVGMQIFEEEITGSCAVSIKRASVTNAKKIERELSRSCKWKKVID